jgi:hypothetical protein
MKYLLFIIVTIVTSVISNAQSSFELLIQNDEDQVPSSIIEDNTGNIICSFYDFDNNNANLIKLNTEGVITDSIKISNPNGLCEISLLIKNENDSFLGLGIYSEDTNNYLWFNKFDEDFDHIIDIKIPVSKKSLELLYAFLFQSNR